MNKGDFKALKGKNVSFKSVTYGEDARKRVGISTINKWSTKTTTAQAIGDTVD